MKFPDKYRVRTGEFATRDGGDYGAFFLTLHGIRIKIIASSGDDEIPWEHVSVSTPHRTPTWDEMDAIKRLFWDDAEAVMQLHPPRSEWVNNHSHCLHLWRPKNVPIPLPPTIAVGVKSLGTLV